ncbi:unnamed protein product [marine sediment metagenome]|uniref:Uncharacterized protein n=1 Tax=marine sediment metagenome TaxID=412755 RepID=X0VCL3_9ZZZZ
MGVPDEEFMLRRYEQNGERNLRPTGPQLLDRVGEAKRLRDSDAVGIGHLLGVNEPRKDQKARNQRNE